MQGYHGDVFSGLPAGTSVPDWSNHVRLVKDEMPIIREQSHKSPGWGV